MKSQLIALLVLTLGAASQASAAANDGRTICPTRNQGETSRQFHDRIRAICETRWQALGASATGSHDAYVNSCAKDCYGDMLATSPGLDVAGYVAAQAAIIAIVTGNSPASP